MTRILTMPVVKHTAMATAVGLYWIAESDTNSASIIVKAISTHHSGTGMPLEDPRLALRVCLRQKRQNLGLLVLLIGIGQSQIRRILNQGLELVIGFDIL